MKKLLFVLLCALPFWAAAQTVTISPIPQSVEWGDQAFQNTTAYTLVGELEADSDAVNVLKANFDTSGGDVQIIIGERGDEAVSEYEDLIPDNSEGYYLRVEADKVIIAGNDVSGTFYGVQSYLQIAAQPNVMCVTITDYPDVTDRGVVEGFYGNPWSQTDRLRQFDFYGANKMNVYVYGPKDDPYHRASWRLDYPAAEAAELQELVQAAHKNKVQFVWAVHPGNDINWNLTDSVNIVNKLESVYSLGVRAFAVFFDDISGEGATAIKQAQLLNYINAEFVSQHDDVAPLMLCPTQYNRAYASGDYLTTLGTEMDEDVRIMWTGNSVVDMINYSDMTWINNQISRKAYIWLNYPVNDYCTDRLLMGPTYGNDKNIANMVSGFTSNPMEYAEASKVSLYSIADYTWNMTDYDENDSWERAIKYLMPEHAEAFHIFCEHNIDLGSTTHGLRRDNESAEFEAAAEVFDDAIADGYTTEAGEPIVAQFDKIVAAADTLLNATTEREMIDEIECWIQVLKLIGQKGQLLMDMYEALNDEEPEIFIDCYLEYETLDSLQKTIISRDYSGSIKTPNPTVGGEVLVPFLKQHLQSLISEYKQTYDYRTDVFPVTLIDDGRYYIMYNGRYLTNKNADADRTGDYPVFQDEVDDVNPMRQQWTIQLDGSTERYKIVNTEDGRYLNEKGAFWASQTNNPYDETWHTYNLYRMNGKYAVQNAGNAGSYFWTASNTRISTGSSNSIVISNFIFDIVPIDSVPTYPTISSDDTYFILCDGKALENTSPNGTGGNPAFRVLNTAKAAQRWSITPVDEVGRYKIVSARDDRYVNENGNFGTYEFFISWISYILTELGGLFSIHNAGVAGDSFWSSTGTRITTGVVSRSESYLFDIVSYNEMTDVKSAATISADGDDISYTCSGNTIVAQTSADVTSITLYGIDGKKLRTTTDSTLTIDNLSRGTYILHIATTGGSKDFKLIR